MAIQVSVTHTFVVNPALIDLGNRLIDTGEKILAALEPQTDLDTTALQAKLAEAEKTAADWKQRAEDAGKNAPPPQQPGA